MREIVRTNDLVTISAIEALLNGAKIKHMVLDQDMSVQTFGIISRRILVDDGDLMRARDLLRDAGLGRELL